MRHLIDTNWVIEHFRGNRKITTRVIELRADGIAISIVSMAELYEGVYRVKDPQAHEQDINAFLQGFAVVPLDDSVSRIYGQETARLRASNMLIGPMDTLIGATAICHGLNVLTQNVKDFERLKGITIISV